MGGRDSRTCFRDIAYQPLPSQKQFHSSTARFKGFSGPIGSGKSQALCHEAIKLSYLNPGRLGLLGAPTYPMLRDATQSSLLEILHKNKIPYEQNKAENTITMLDTRSRIVFRPVDEFDRLRGTNLAWFGVDELTYTQEEAWVVLEGRLRDPKASRLCGFAVWTPKGFDWVYERFVANRVEGYDVTLAQAYENHHLLEKVPDFYDRLKKSYDGKFFEQEVLGKYLSTRGGLVYHAFDRRQHVQDVAADSRRPLLWALDFNVEPMCSVVAQVDGERIIAVDEIVLSRATTEQACEEFAARFLPHYAGVVIYGDASGNRMQTSGASDYGILRNFFRKSGYTDVVFKVPNANPAVRDRIGLVNAKLKPACGEPQLKINPKCVELIKDLEQVSYKQDSTIIDKDKDPRRTHLSDALGYLIWEEHAPRPPFGDQPHRIF